jgi:hypothetical protein
MEKERKCQFCGCLIGEDFRHQELYVCIECWTLLTAIIEDSLPMTMHQVGEKADNAKQNRLLKPYHYEEKDTK